MVLLKVKKVENLVNKGEGLNLKYVIELNDVENDDQKGFETNELFVLKTNWIQESAKKTIEIHDFTLKIEFWIFIFFLSMLIVSRRYLQSPFHSFLLDNMSINRKW